MRSKMSAIGTSDSAFHDGNPSTGELGTIVTADWLNAVQASTMDLQDELLSVLAAASIANDPAVKTQILAAINKLSKLNMQSGSATFATDTGAANAYVVSLTPALASPRGEGMVIRFKVANTNTGACTVNDGVGTVPIVGLALSALQGGEMAAGGDAWIQWHPSVGTGSYVLLLCSRSPSQIANGKKSQQAVAVNQLFGLLKGMQRFTSSGSFTVPDNVTIIYVSGCAGGGGGGSGAGSSPSVVGGGGAGGGCGDYTICTPYAVTPGQVIAITIGGAGSGGAAAAWGATGNNGSPGGNTVIGSLVTLTGGGYGAGGLTGATVGNGGAVNGFNNGGNGAPSVSGNIATGFGGDGGDGPFGGAGKGGASNGNSGTNGHGFGTGGAGGGGNNSLTNSNGAAGQNGKSGLVIIQW